MSRATHTHRGHCQACGALQAIETGREAYMPRAPIAKHGYKVQWGYFAGVCHGSDHPAMEFDRTYTDTVCAELTTRAAACDAHAIEYAAGRVHPEKIITGQRDTGRRDPHTYRRVYEDVAVSWADATPEQQRKALDGIARELESNARDMRAHVKTLGRLVVEYHGKEPRAVTRKPKPREIVAGLVFTHWGREWRVTKLVHRGMSRGNSPNYADCERTDGKTATTAAIREAIANGRSIDPEFRPLLVSIRNVRKALGA